MRIQHYKTSLKTNVKNTPVGKRDQQLKTTIYTPLYQNLTETANPKTTIFTHTHKRKSNTNTKINMVIKR